MKVFRYSHLQLGLKVSGESVQVIRYSGKGLSQIPIITNLASITYT